MTVTEVKSSHTNGHVADVNLKAIADDGGNEIKWPLPVVEVDEVDPRDVGTPDAWIKRHPSLVRLTGRHPFNCEPPLPVLMSHGFLTPASLHYVRSHGAVPQVPLEKGDDWTVSVSGLVRNPRTFTVAELKAMPSRTLPVTLVCAGNRRKEQNMVKQTIGFSWGAAGVSNSVWKGVLLCDVLKVCGILPRSSGALHVCFEGSEILPGGGGSTYGTGVKRELAIDPANDIILAYEQNGQPLQPDHGFPIRMIIPGFIGGRMVKWLKKIDVQRDESNSHYHFNDNRVLPSHIDAETASKEGWWYRPSYIINQLNINSAISSPSHGQVVTYSPESSSEEVLTVQGYSYTGGGREIIRVEVSLDGGASWRLTNLTLSETPTEYGRFWCWIFWSIEVKLSEIQDCDEIVCRAWDASQNTQPEHLTWNVMGMMNNCWFRVHVHSTEKEGGKVELRFEHPTLPGTESGGWMQTSDSLATERKPRKLVQKKDEKVPETTEEAPAAMEEHEKVPMKEYTMAEVKKHTSDDSAWIVVRGRVYDCTKFLEDHPGGAASITMNAGTDSTEDFDAIHSKKAHEMLEEYCIGVLAKEASGKPHEPVEEASDGALVALDPKKKIAFPLIEREELSHDTRRFRFGLQSAQHSFGLPVGKHVYISATVNNSAVMRAYTPTSTDDDKGFFDLVVKVYYKGVVEAFPDGGLMSQHLDSLAIGDTVDVKGPTGHIHYKAPGLFDIGGKERRCKRIALLGGGTGITPLYQVMKAIVRCKEDDTEVWLLYANKTEEDILLRSDLDSWASSHPNVHVWYTIDGASKSDSWQYGVGRINYEMMCANLPAAGEDCLAFMCGPPGMIKFACIPNLEKMGYSKSNLFTF